MEARAADVCLTARPLLSSSVDLRLRQLVQQPGLTSSGALDHCRRLDHPFVSTEEPLSEDQRPEVPVRSVIAPLACRRNQELASSRKEYQRYNPSALSSC